MVTIPITRPLLGREEQDAVARVLNSGWVMQGPEVEAFEQELKVLLQGPEVVAVANGTAALHLALLALGVGPGDEIITVSSSFIATANAIRHCGAVPIFVDIRKETMNLDPRGLALALSPRTRAVLCVHQLGMPCDLEAIKHFTDQHGLPLVEDAACALGSEIRYQGQWQPVGGPVGAAACFSFHPRKVITMGEGGAITTGDPDLADRLRLLRNQGMRKLGPTTTYPVVGYNQRLTDLQAAMGRVQLTRLPEIVRRRRALARSYNLALSGISGITCPADSSWTRSNWQSYWITLESREARDHLLTGLQRRGIAAIPGLRCIHLEEAYQEYAGLELPGSEEVAARTLMLPLFPGLEEEQPRVIEAVSDLMMT